MYFTFKYFILNMYINMSSSMSKVIINIDNKSILLANIEFICKRFKAHLHHQSFPSKTWSKFLTENWLKENFVKVIPFTRSKFLTEVTFWR